MKTNDVISYVLSKKSMSYYELTRLLYAMQYECAIKMRPSMMPDAQFFAAHRNIVVEKHAQERYCAYGANPIFVPRGEKRPDLSPEESHLIDELMEKYGDIPMNDPELFGNGSLVATIWDNLPKLDLPVHLRQWPPINYTAMVQFIHGYQKQGTINVSIPIDPYVCRTFEPLMKNPLDHESYGIVPWRRILEWTNTPTPVYTVRLSIMAEDKDMPLGFVVDLLCSNCVVQSLTFNEIPDRIPMEHDGYEFKITTR